MMRQAALHAAFEAELGDLEALLMALQPREENAAS